MWKNSRLIFSGCAALALLSAAPAHAIDPLDLQVSRLGDVDMNCGELAQEAVLMRDIIFTTEDIKDKSEMQSRGITAAGAVASFLVGTATGGIGLAAAGFLAEHQVDEKGEDADSVQDIAEQRRSLMLGIHNAKGCLGPIEHALQTPLQQGGIAAQLAAIEAASGVDADTPGDAPNSRYND